MPVLEYLWIIPLLPLLGSAINGLFGSQWQRAEEELTEEEKEVAFVCGLLELDNITLASAPDFIKW